MLSGLSRLNRHKGWSQLLQHCTAVNESQLRAGAQSNPCSCSNSKLTELRQDSLLLGLSRTAASSTASSHPPPGPVAATASPASPTVSRRRLNMPPLPPWTPTKDLTKRNCLPRRMGFLIQELDRERAQMVHTQKQMPDFQAGDVLELKLIVPENRRRVSTFKGLCIAKKNRGWASAFTLRNVIANAGPVERTFPLYSPTIEEIKVVEHRKVRRAKLYYLRGVNPKEYRA